MKIHHHIFLYIIKFYKRIIKVFCACKNGLFPTIIGGLIASYAGYYTQVYTNKRQKQDKAVSQYPLAIAEFRKSYSSFQDAAFKAAYEIDTKADKNSNKLSGELKEFIEAKIELDKSIDLVELFLRNLQVNLKEEFDSLRGIIEKIENEVKKPVQRSDLVISNNFCLVRITPLIIKYPIESSVLIKLTRDKIREYITSVNN